MPQALRPLPRFGLLARVRVAAGGVLRAPPLRASHSPRTPSKQTQTNQVAMRALGFEPKKEEIRKLIADVDGR